MASDQQIDRYEGDPGKRSSHHGWSHAPAPRSARSWRNASRKPKRYGRRPTRIGPHAAFEPWVGSVTGSGRGRDWNGGTGGPRDGFAPRVFSVVFPACSQSGLRFSLSDPSVPYLPRVHVRIVLSRGTHKRHQGTREQWEHGLQSTSCPWNVVGTRHGTGAATTAAGAVEDGETSGLPSLRG